jgi:NitT/TauT family transport system substrate-binding protein
VIPEYNRLATRLAFILLVLGLVLAACSQASPTPATPGEPVTIRLALLPILDALPLYVAEEQGYFTEHGIQVEFIPVSSAGERDQIIGAGQADGMINELVSTLFYNQDEVRIQVVRFARTATPDFPQFRILAAAGSGIENVDDLKGVEIGISEGTVIEYLTDRLLQEEGFQESEVATISVPGIPDRLALLNSGELKAAMLPDPLSSLAMQAGASVVIDDTRHPEFGYSVISLVKPLVDENPEAVREFLAAVERAVVDINNDPQAWEDVLTERSLVPAPLIGSYQIPQFPLASVPSEAQFQDAVDWAQAEGLVSSEFAYADSVTAAFLP